MEPTAIPYNPHSIETEVVALWKARRLPSPGGVLGPPGGPTVRQFIGSWTQGDLPALVVQRAILADVDARCLSLAGRRVGGTLRQWTGAAPGLPTTVPALLASLGIWTGGDGRTPWDSADRTAGIQTIVERLAGKEILVTRDEAFRTCPTCGTLRSPERIVYDEQEGDTYLVRFPIRVGELTVNALVWVDAPWKLLGASALLVNPNLRYVVAGYRRRDDRELILTSAASLDRLRSWIPESVLEVVEERPGREFQGIAYTYPLRHEFPMGGDLEAPGGTILGAADVGDSGTGIVPLVPGHGPTDARIADRLGVTGWPLLTPKGRLDFTLMHKYAGLDLETANEFVLRDLSEAGALLARLRVKRGVPYCALCGTALLWAPARAWCLEPSRLPPERRATFARLLPKDVLPGQGEVAPWPVSDSSPSEDPSAVSLLECARCDRLEALSGSKQCPCGGQRNVVRRKLLPSFGAAIAGWARFDPFPDGDSAHIYVGHRRRVPSLVHHLVGLSGVEGSVTDVSLTVVPTVGAPDAADLVARYGADVVRSAVVRIGLSESAGGRFADQCRRESDRIRRWWTTSREVVSMCDPGAIAAFARPIGGFLGELEVEDRAIVARWERTRVLAVAHFDHGAPGLVHRRVARFLDNDFAEYRELVQPRLALAGSPPTKRAALRTLVHLLRGVSEVLAPIAPFTAESVHRSLSSERTSLFEQPMVGLDRSLVSDDLVASWDRWRTVLRSLDRFRRSLGIPRTTVVPSLVLVVAGDDVGDRLRAEKEVLARLARVQRIEVGSPREPWVGRQRVLHPVESEIQKVYPAQASQIVHLLRRMGPRRAAGGGGEEELSVVIDGYPVRVFPTMVAYVDSLPKRMVPVAWPLGDMYAELLGDAAADAATFPPLSSDAFWLVRRVERRLKAAPPVPGQSPRIALVTVKDPLASELRAAAEPIARYLGLGEFRVVEKSEEAVPPYAMTGRTRTGDRWWVHVPGLPAPRPREKHPSAAVRVLRVAFPPPTAPAEEVDFSDEKVVAHAEAVRALGQELDDLVGLPLLGPAKISVAWDRGVQSVDDFRHATFEAVSALPGFGGPVAEIVVAKLGGTVPPRPWRDRGRNSAPRTVRRPPVEPTHTPGPASPPVLPSVPEEPTPEPTPEATLVTSPREESTEPPVLVESPEPVAGPTGDEPQPVLEPIPVAPSVPLEEIPPAAPSRSEAVEEVNAAETAPSPVEPLAPETESEPEPAPVPEEGPLELAPVSLAPDTGAVPEPMPLPEEPGPLPETPELEVVEPVPESHPPPAAVESPPVELTTAAFSMEPADGGPSAEESPVPEPTEAESSAEKETTAFPAPEVTGAPSVEERAPTTESQEPSPEVVPAEEAGPDASPSEQVPPEITEAVPEETPLPEIPPPETVPPDTLPPEPSVAIPPEPAEPTVVEPIPEVPPPSEEGPPVEPPPEVTTIAPELAPSPASTETTGDASAQATPPQPLPEPPIVPAPPVSVPPPPPPPVEPAIELASPPVIVTPSVPVPAPIALPAMVPTEVEPPALPSGVELTVGESLVVALSGFLDSTSAGHHGVCVVRESPERIRARVGSRPIEVYWLSNIGRGPSLRPSDLDGLWGFLQRKVVEEHATAFFLEGIEYLVRIHGADAVLTGLVQFDRLARENDARVWVCLTPALMRPADIDRFRATFGSGSAPG